MIETHSKAVVSAANNAALWSTQVRDLAMEALGTDNLTAATLFINNAEGIMAKAWDSAKQAYWSSQDMGTYTPRLAPPPPSSRLLKNPVWADSGERTG